jgi:hypothetical protein
LIVNLFSLQTPDVTGIASAGRSEADWLAARSPIDEALHIGDVALVAWGTTEPSGPARLHHRDQVDWIRTAIRAAGLQAWAVGSLPRHPSRWQRYTARVHPSLPFGDALARSLQEWAPTVRTFDS